MKERRSFVVWILALTFLSAPFYASYMSYLRSKFARELPQEWEKVANNGSFAVASTMLVTAKNIEEGPYGYKVRQAFLHGFPYDPYTGEKGLESWIFDSLAYYPLVPFLYLARGSLDWGWVWAQGTCAALWVLSFFLLFRRYGLRMESAGLAACVLFFFIDPLRAALNIPASPPSSWPRGFFFLLTYCTGQVQWLRLPTPGMNPLFTFWALAGAYALSLSPSRRTAASFALGAASALLAFGHPFEWVFASGGLICFFALSSLRGLSPEGRWNLGWASLASAVLSASYAAFSTRLHSQSMPDIVSRVGMSVEFYPGSLLHLGWGLLFLWKSGRESGVRARLWTMWSALEFMVFASVFIPYVLGYNLLFYPHLSRLGEVAVLLALACWSLEREPLLRRIEAHAWVLAAMVFLQVYMREKAWSDTHYKIFGTPGRIEEGMRWLNARAPGEPLVLSLSAVTTQLLPARTDARSLVTDGSPAWGSPVSNERIFRGLARLLVTARADAELFLRERWYGVQAHDYLKQQTAYFTRSVSLEACEAANWPYFLLNNSGWSEPVVRARAQELKRYLREEKPLETPYYLWVNRSDEKFLTKPPESFGCRLVYENPGMRLFFFSGKPRPPGCAVSRAGRGPS